MDSYSFSSLYSDDAVRKQQQRESRDEPTRGSQNRADAEIIIQLSPSRDEATHGYQDADNSESIRQQMSSRDETTYASQSAYDAE